MGKGTRIKTKGEEGALESVIAFFLPIWLPIKAIQMMIKDIMEERRKKREE